MGHPAVVELAEVAPPLARLEVVMAEVGLAEAALVGLAALEVAGQVAALGLAAAEAKRQLVLHCRSGSFYMEAHTRYHRMAQSLSSAACSTRHFYLSLLAFLFLFMAHDCPTFFVILNVDSELLLMLIFDFILQPLPPLGMGSGENVTWGIIRGFFTGEKEDNCERECVPAEGGLLECVCELEDDAVRVQVRVRQAGRFTISCVSCGGVICACCKLGRSGTVRTLS